MSASLASILFLAASFAFFASFGGGRLRAARLATIKAASAASPITKGLKIVGAAFIVAACVFYLVGSAFAARYMGLVSSGAIVLFLIGVLFVFTAYSIVPLFAFLGRLLKSPDA